MKALRAAAIAATLLLSATQPANSQQLYAQVKSFQEIENAQRYLVSLSKLHPDAQLFRSSNGWYAIALGPWEREDARVRLDRLKSIGAVPDDSFLTPLQRSTAVTLSPIAGAEGFGAKPVAGTTENQNRNSKPVGGGSGFFINEFDALTNWHVIDGCTHLSAGDGTTLSVVAADSNLDVALLRSARPSRSWLAFADGDTVGLGATVYVLGFPLYGILSKSISLTKGVKSGRHGLGDNADQFRISAQLQPGNSGGPVLNSSGEVIGLAVARLNDKAMYALTGALPQDINFAVDGMMARQFAAKAGAGLAPNTPPIANLERDGLPDWLERATIPVLCYE